jgi:eukaryotic-like serine/threonine-protein kinase
MDDDLILGRYRLLERLAVGGSAEVWRARDEQLGREVAVKRIHPHLIPDDAARSRLVTEARAVAALSHPVVVGIYDVDAGGEWPALVMELVDGESLAARIARDGPLPAAEAARVGADLADALFHAHQRGVIHRDVKPGNVLLGADGRTRLVDFGIAHSLAAGTERLTLEGTVIGTLHAMAPEQLAGGPITPRTDLYGLGVVLHEALTGRPPYPATTPVALADAQRAGPPAVEVADPALAAVVAACLSFEPSARPLHAGALAEALRAWLAGDREPALAMAPIGPVDTAAVTQPVVAATAATAGGEPPPRTTTRRAAPAPWSAILLAAIAGIAVLGGAALVGGGLNGGIGDEAPSASTPAVATPSPAPEWLAELLNEVRKHCGDDAVTAAAAELTGLSREDAQERVKQLEEACKEAREGQGGGNGEGRGNGNGNGNGNGRGGGGD